MARVGFRTIGSCAGHQVTAAQLAVLPAQRRTLGGRNFLWGGAGGFKELRRWWRYYRCPLFQAGLYLLSSWRVFFSSLKEAVGFGELNPSRGTGCTPSPALSKTYFPMQAHNPASRPGGGYQLAQLCVLQPARLPPGRPMGATRASCASAPRRPGAR